ncbi:MAG TPA: hypothetical protein VMF68_12735 [Spirochaetia bacterium]|nr:hypothetical protein [Spirochaetia bacterium]
MSAPPMGAGPGASAPGPETDRAGARRAAFRELHVKGFGSTIPFDQLDAFFRRWG